MAGKEIYEWLRERRVAKRRDERQRGRVVAKRYMND
jgi:hypothetical protein